MTNYSLRGLLNNVLALFALVSVTFTALSSAQTNPSSNQTTATTTANSRAEKEAEQLVSLSAERIIALLENEPGLMLEVKKMLVRTAYDQ